MDDQQQQQQPAVEPAPPAGDPEQEFPANTPVAEMTDAQRAAYYKHQNRKAEARLAAFKGATPEQVQQLQTRVSEMEAERETAGERALREAAEAAANEARAAARAEFEPKLHRSQLKAIASQVLSSDQVDAWLEDVTPSNFVNDSGEIDEAKVKAKLTALFGAQKSAPPNWGQHGATPPGETPGSAGAAEAKRRLEQRQQ
ncbi:hypothetical protein ABW16_21525 [Mycolicibacter heraklionensis]|uniref:Scaffolding protein n=1 Tax=Mycolicibacter heraklionensis TaxID=512402 RepID=A0ABR5FA20_9MYCO|nr:hypothetical protein [Mycolicibacter heraklionensis]KLO25896.1 hypothetical protein ABW16_21525 [Mycolicibacter heraklionensis]